MKALIVILMLWFYYNCIPFALSISAEDRIENTLAEFRFDS